MKYEPVLLRFSPHGNLEPVMDIDLGAFVYGSYIDPDPPPYVTMEEWEKQRSKK
jgi:hypothetical protein